MGDLTRIAIFYDGNYFGKVSDYYRYQHTRQRRLSFDGIHNFIRAEAASGCPLRPTTWRFTSGLTCWPWSPVTVIMCPSFAN